MAVRVVFLEVDTERAWAVASIGPGFIGAYLRTHGHEVGFVRASVDQTDEEVVNRVAAEEPDIVGISLTTRQWLRGRQLIGALRNRQPTASPIFGSVEVTDHRCGHL